jgi:hypothetical protein
MKSESKAGKRKPENLRLHKASPGKCSYCDRERDAGISYHPPHDASEHCKSGKHPHCSCDICF